MATLTLYHKPTCSKSREAKKLLDDAGVEYETILYIEEPLSFSELKDLAKMLDGDVRDLIRDREARSAGWDGDDSKEAILRFLADHPEAMQRPILTDGKRAVIGRPTENVKVLL